MNASRTMVVIGGLLVTGTGQAASLILTLRIFEVSAEMSLEVLSNNY